MNSAVEIETELFACESCGAELNVAKNIRALVCPYCASPSVVTRPVRPDRPSPDFVVPFVVEEAAACEAVRRFLGQKAFAPRAIKKASLANVRGVYLPSYLYSAVASSDYHAQIGEEYIVVETYTVTNSEGKTETRTRTKIEIEWRRLTGTHEMYVKDIVVTASKGLPNAELEAVEPFDLRVLRRFSSALIVGWPAEEASMSKEACLELAHEETRNLISSTLSAFMPGDSHRSLHFSSDLNREAVSLCLLPLWVFAVRYHPKKPPLRIVVNGQSAQTAGKIPLSVGKIMTLVGLGLLAIGLVYFVGSQ